MPSQDIRVEVTAGAPAGVVFALLRDGARWPTCSPLGSFELEREGEREREGVGAIRIFRTGRITSRERIVEVEPDRRFSYVLISGLAIRNYRAVIELEPAGEQTQIRWRSEFDAKVPGSGWIYRIQLGRFIERLVRGLAGRAEQDAAAQSQRGPGPAPEAERPLAR
jgi:Polyketide cyclase / dehydrase and lipid transport